MNTEQIFKKIETMDPEALSHLICKSLDESNITYKTDSSSNIVFTKLIPVQDIVYFTVHAYKEANTPYTYEVPSAVPSRISWSSPSYQRYQLEESFCVA